MGTLTNFDELEIGDTLTSATETIGHVQMFFFSAATYNGHRIHYDKTWATEIEGHPDLLIQGPLQASLMAKVLTDWIAPHGRLVRFQFQNRASAYVGATLRFVAAVTDTRRVDDELNIEIDFRVENEEGKILMPGTATVMIPRPTA
jgi:hydroxyacyl-ACP dehydratase HTD2-like protein with hotdog domain